MKTETLNLQKKPLGDSDLLITRMGFGAWAIGGSGWEFAWGKQNDEASVAAIHRALELGINWIDTAAVYGMGHSETIVGQALKSWSGPRPYVFTKCALRWDEKGRVSRVLDSASIRRECEDSLRRLGVDAIDLYQIHWPAEKIEEIKAAWLTLANLKREGKVRWIGVSNFDVAQMESIRDIAPITSLQPPYSLIHREVENEILPYCSQNGIGVIVYSPMGSGLLTGAMTRERIAKLPPDDWRARDPQFQEPKLSENLAIVENLKRVGARYHRPAGQVAVAWTLRYPAVTAAIVGARDAKQVEEIAGAAELRLTPDDIAEIESHPGLAQAA